MRNSNTAENLLFETVHQISYIDEDALTHAKEIFEEYTLKGIIKDSKFEDTVWQTTDEYSNKGLHFNFNHLSFKRFYEDLFCMSFETFIDYIKVFILFTMGKNVLNTLQSAINDLKRIIRTNPEEIIAESTKLKLTVANICINFFTMLPEPENEALMDRFIGALSNYGAINYQNHSVQRSLAQFDSYFLFNDIMNDYWKQKITKEERLFYYPVYLWWQVTAIIPLRPREFILTARDCLSQKEDEYYLTLRRNNLKGTGKQVNYKISADYFNVTYKIPEWLGQEFERYLELTKSYESTEIDTLFVADTHYKKWNHRKHSNSRYFTYINLNRVLQYFFREVIEERYRLNVVYEKNIGHLCDDEIHYINLGDTRHIALINIMAEGGTPITAMLLAGHSDINMAAHYYSNITNLIECRTYRQYRLATKGETAYQVSFSKKLPTRNQEFLTLSDGCLCYSAKFAEDDFDDCMSAVGPTGELGYCPTCRFYRKKGNKYFSVENMYKRRIKDDCNYLESAIKLARAGKGATESIGEAMLRLQNSSYTYQQYRLEKLSEEQCKGESVWDENVI